LIRFPRVALVAHWDWVHFNFRLPLAHALRDAGCDVTFVCPRGDYFDRLAAEKFRCVEWNVTRRSMNPLRETASLWKLTSVQRNLRPDVIQNFTIKPNFYGSLSARLSRVPRIINTYSGLGYLFSNETLKPALLRTALSPAFRLALRARNVHSVFETQEDLDFLSRAKIVDRSRSTVVSGTGINIQIFRPHPTPNANPGGASDKPLVLMASRLLWDKGIADFVEAADRLRSDNVDADFCIAGETDPGNPASIPRGQIGRWEERYPVRFLGNRSDMADLLRRTRVAVLPSHHEGISRFLMEAAASAVPIVATDIKGCRRVVRHEQNGYLVPPGDPAALATAIARIVRSDSLRDTMASQSRQIAVAEFDEQEVLDQYLDVYRKLGILAPRRVIPLKQQEVSPTTRKA
jgi:glycosyltransferase involved in cell wall biosynthesis